MTTEGVYTPTYVIQTEKSVEMVAALKKLGVSERVIVTFEIKFDVMQ